MARGVFVLALVCLIGWATVPSHAWAPRLTTTATRPTTSSTTSLLRMATTSQEEKKTAEETTEKFGLEAGLFQSLRQNDGESAKSLLKRYGIAYLATSIPLAMISFAICYVLVDNGVDVAGLLRNVGIETSNDSLGTTAGTVAIAYAAHKAASPIRFPPTVILTPVVAKLIGKEPEEVDDDDSGAEEAESKK